MTFLLTTLPLWLSAVILIVPTTLLAMAGPVIVRRYVDVNQLRTNNEVAGFKFATVGVLYAVLLAFAVVVVWEKFNQAESEVAKEAGAAATVFRLTQGVDPERGAAIREATTAYLRSAIESDWPAMESGTQSPATTEALNEIYRAILKFQSLGTDDEMFARCQEKCPHVALVPEVAAGDRLPEPVSALAEKARLLAAVPDHPLDEAQFVIHRWRGVPVVRDRDVGLGGKVGHRQGGGSSKHEAAPAEQRRRAKLDGGRMPPVAMRDLF